MDIRRGLFYIFLITSFFIATGSAAAGESGIEAAGGMNMKITSPEFENNKFIPKKFSGQGQDVSPTLIIEGIPAGTKSLVLIVDDPDAPRGTWVHWVVYDIPVISKIEEGGVPGKQGMTDSGRAVYHGPYPPSGVHRYFFKLYALDVETIGLKEGATKADVEKAMKGRILDKAELIGLYKRL